MLLLFFLQQIKAYNIYLDNFYLLGPNIDIVTFIWYGT